MGRAVKEIRMKRKWIAVLMCVCLLLSNTAFAAGFADVGEAHAWAKAEIENYAERGILSGDGTGNFLPDDNVTRAEFAKMLCLVFDLRTEAELGYTDVDKDSWQYTYVAKTDAFVYTDNGEIYAPDAAATRAELAYAIVNAAGFELQEVQMPFEDADSVISDLQPQVKTAYALELLKGYPDNTFRPNAAVTRAEAVVLLSRAEKVLAQLPQKEEKPVEKEENQPADKATVMPLETLFFVKEAQVVLHPETQEPRLRIYAYMSGSERLWEVYTAPDVPIYDIDGTPTALAEGDVFCIDGNIIGSLQEIRIVLHMGKEPLLAQPAIETTAFLDKLGLPTGWNYLGENAKQEVYLGFLGELKEENGQIKLSIYSSDGQKRSGGVREVSVSADATVMTYTTKAKAKERFGFTTAEEIEFYGPTKNSMGDITWEENADTEFYQYVFVKTKKDEVTDLILISNQ